MADPLPNEVASGRKSPPDAPHFAQAQHADVPCACCGCLCDDLQVFVAADRVIQVEGACPVARAQMLALDTARPEAQIAGHAVPRADAIREAARLLAAARKPLVWGLGRATCEAQAVAVEITQILGGVIDVPGSDETFQTVGEVTCTFGEMRQRADLILIWGADPLQTHPRLLERHAPPGVSLTVVEASQSCTGSAAGHRLQIEPRRSFEAATVLRALLRGLSLEAGQVAEQTGVALSEWRELLERMKLARYGVLLSGASSDRSAAESVALARLVRELNAHERWVHVALSNSVNTAGAASVLSSRTGFSHGVDFSCARLTENSAGLVRAEQLLERGEVDAALIVCDDAAEMLSSAAQRHLATIPRVVIDSHQNDVWKNADIALTVALPGIEAGGTMFRMDGVPLALRRLIDSPIPADFEVLRSLAAEIRAARHAANKSDG